MLQEKTRHKTELHDFESRLQTLDNELGTIKKTLNDFQKQSSNRALAFGNYTDVITKNLQQNSKRFDKVPIGPVGLHLSITDPKWAKSCETCVGPLLNSYIVHSKEDEVKFFALLKEKEIPTDNINCIIQHFRIEQYTPSNLPENCITVISKIRSDHPLILNVLMDQRKAERCVLVNTGEEAHRVLDSSNPESRKIANVYDVVGAIYTKKGEAINSDHSQIPKPTVLTDCQSQIILYSERYQEKEKEILGLQHQRSKTRFLSQDVETEIRRLQNLKFKMSKNIDDCNDQIKEIQNEPLPVDQSELKKNWEQSIEEINRDIEEREVEKEKLTKVLLELKIVTDPIEEAIQEHQQKLDLKFKTAQNLEVRLTKIATCQSKLKIKEDVVVETVNNINNVLTQKKEKHNELKQANEATIASIKSERVELSKNETTTALENLLQTLTKQLEEQAKNQRSLTEDILPEFQNVKEKLSGLKEEMSRLRGIYNRYEKALPDKQKLYLNLLQGLTTRLKQKFRSNLANKGFSGRLIIDHKARTLEMEITPTNRQEQKDTSSLSGGERSFSTVSLLMSMWNVMENSICAMDEFDVFMDMHSRQRSIEMLVEMAKINKDRQFIFISPQAMGSVPKGPEIQLIEVDPPVRGLQ